MVTKQLDLTDEAAVRRTHSLMHPRLTQLECVTEINPHVILHTAAICHSESVGKDRARALAVNVKACLSLDSFFM